MYCVINKTGVCENKGRVQVRVDCYLEEGEEQYDKFYVSVLDIPPEGYPGELTDEGSPKDLKDFELWMSKLPTKMVNTPFCCHFVYLSPIVTDEDVAKTANDVLKMAYGNLTKNRLSENKTPIIPPNPFAKASAETRVAEIKNVDYSKVKVSGEEETFLKKE